MKGNLDINTLIEEYQNQISEIIKDNIFLKAYVKQLEKQLEECSTVVTDNESK